MNIYLLLYSISSFVILLSWILIWKKLQNISWIFFFIYALTSSIWFVLYFVFFSWILEQEYQYLFLSRISFWLSIICVYALIIFTAYFGKSSLTLNEKRFATWIGILFIIIFIYSGFSPLIVEKLRIEEGTWIYREVMWSLFPVHLVWYILFPILLLAIFFKRIRQITWIVKTRFIHTSMAGALFLITLIILQVVLPYMNIWILEKELVILADAYILYVFYITSRYYFRSIWYDIAKILSIIISTIIWIIAMNFFDSWLGLLPEGTSWLWWSRDIYGITNFLLWLWTFSLSYKISLRYIFWKIFENSLSKRVFELERIIAQIMNIEEINRVIWKELEAMLQISCCEIKRIPDNEKYTHPFYLYFRSNKNIQLYINDPSFIEEKERTHNLTQVKKEVPDKYLIVVPLFWKNKSLLGVFMIGNKKRWNFFDSYEIEQIEKFWEFLSHHIQYLNTYHQLEDISRNLDRKVDEKTIEYNTLISRQKKFIATLSHEIKTPLTSALLQIDNLSTDIEDRKLSETGIQEEVVSIGENLVHTKTLLSQLFTTEYLEKNQAVLYPERINIVELITSQYNIQKKVNLHCTYTETIPRSPIFMSIDKTQFTQVLTNLFWNAAKFADSKNPKIHLELEQDESSILIGIEDNGHGLSGIELNEIFEKYTIGKNSIGLGIGLYLCKRIVEMHEGTITAKKWRELSWIRMEIRIPIEQI